MGSKFSAIGLLSLVCLVVPAAAQETSLGEVSGPEQLGFSFDLSLEDARKELGKITYAEIPLGQKRGASAWAFCRHDGELWIRQDQLVREIRSEYLSWISIVRTPDGYDVALEKNNAGKLDLDQLEGILLARDCEQVARANGDDIEQASLGRILTVQGATTGRELLLLIKGGSLGDGPTARDSDSKWVVSEKKDDITDQPNVYAILDSSKAIRDNFGNTSYPSLVLRCQRNTTSAYIVHGEYEVNDTMSASYRLDGGQHVVKRFSTSSDHKAAGLWGGSTAIPFMKSLEGKSTLTLRLEGRSTIMDMEFSLTGVDDILGKIAAACNWTL
ncbi:hypothetical protein [Pseudodonghicola sp.]|uniref:hypothetical protein n=1 Tax=Pseudodonghicola sp. TaxID=1969463 RepID=UPI003A980A0C